MIEHLHDYNSDIYHSNYSSEQNLSPEVTIAHNQEPLNNPVPTEQAWEQQNEIDYTQSDFNRTEDYYSSGYGEMELPSNFYGSDLSDLNNNHHGNQHLSSSYEQPDYSVEQNYYESSLAPQDYNTSLLENNYGGVLNHHQRTGKMITLNELGKDHKIGDIITEDGKDYKIVDYAPIHGGYDVIRVEHYPDGTYKEQGFTNTFLPKPDVTLENKSD
jgi:hypothetical protein